ncbi:MAG: hypothetical protein DWP92_08590 [Armatimonadetes bacterium]|nr:MAG: hypothetical protein DWP92_08590 [Armatimonadota bacterium]
MGDHAADRYLTEGFERLTADAGEGPEWSQVGSPAFGASRAPERRGGLLVGLAVGVVAVMTVGVVALSQTGGGTPVAEPTIEYVKLAWSQETELTCTGMNTQDNGGFDNATIEIWGPNTDGLVRIDATAPDGTVERIIFQYSIADGRQGQVWSIPGQLGAPDTVFHESACVTSDADGTGSYSIAQSPLAGQGADLTAFVRVPSTDSVGSPFDVEQWLEAGGTAEDGDWLGTPVTVYTMETTEDIETGGRTSGTSTTWFDTLRSRYERVFFDSRSETLGSVKWVVEVVERDTVAESSASFSTDGLFTEGEKPSTPTPDSSTTTLPIDGPDPSLQTSCGPVSLGAGQNPVLPTTVPDADVAQAIADAEVSLGLEGAFFGEFEFFVAEQTPDSVILFGTGTADGAPSYAYATFRLSDGTWAPSGWGGCHIETTAEGWGTADWILDPAVELDSESTQIAVLIQERECASGQAPIGREIVPVVVRSADRITITVFVERVQGDATCPSNPWHPITIDLDEAPSGLPLYNGRPIPNTLVLPGR